jgi:hypothetical protein
MFENMLLINKLRTPSAVLSILGASFIIVTYTSFKDIRNPASKLVLWLSVADLVLAISVISQSIFAQLEYCGWFAAWEYCFCISTYCWVCCIAHNMLLSLHTQHISKQQAREKWYHLVSWGVPIAFTGFLLIQDEFGMVTAWKTCWIKDAWTNPYYYVFYYVPLCGTYLFLVIVFWILVRRLKKMGAPVDLVALVKRSATFYLVVFMFCWLNIWLSTTFVPIVGAFPLWFVEVGSTMYPLQGFLDSIVYGLNGRVRAKYSEVFCGKKKRTHPDETQGLINESMENAVV